MAHRVIATRTDANWNLVEEAEFVSINEELKEIFLEFGWVKPYDDTKPLPPKGLNDYEAGMIYPINRFVIKNGSICKSNCETSPTWVDIEWDIKVAGTTAV